MKLQLAMVFAKDIEHMTAFYRDGLGLTPLPQKSSEGWVVFDAEGTLFALHAIPPLIARSIEISDPPQARSDTQIKLVFEATNLEEVCARVIELGGQVLPSGSPGWRDALDPEGNVLQLKGS